MDVLKTADQDKEWDVKSHVENTAWVNFSL
jgi:hypothetical protein